jgi:catechol 2,3-dioxygenase-like lactoylglutathione lyase family enzyme
MALTTLLDLELTVPDPDGLGDFWVRRGMVATAPGVLGTADRPTQLRLRDGPYRHVSELRLGCSSPADLDAAAGRLAALGLSATRVGDTLRVADPVLDHVVVLEVGDAPALTPVPPRATNGPGRTVRTGRRAPGADGTAATTPRRVGHVVFGTPDVDASLRFYRDGLGLLVSDGVGGIGWFLRCSTDHHNLLLMPSPVPCLNHYAVELDDVDAIGAAGTAVVGERPGCSVYGPGRHVLGSNLFWYLLDPAGGMFELFADMDQIVDAAAWDAGVRRDDWDPFSIAAWEPGPSLPDFFLPADLDDLARGREAAGR